MTRPAIILTAFLTGFVCLAATIDLNVLLEYSAQNFPAYVAKDNTPFNNQLTDKGATLGRVLFYDKKLSANNTISCASCHKQQFAFGDTAVRSTGLNGGLTGRHAMRLVNARFGAEDKFFWDERASSLEDQTTRPVKDHVEMGFSGTNGDPGIDSLIRKLQATDYYQELFTFVFGTTEITENKIQLALAQFIRSIQSFDSKFDIGRAQVANNNAPFPNFTAQENEGKTLFLLAPPAGGAGCQGCHRAPEFDIDPNSLNNGIIIKAGNQAGTDLTNTRAASLRDIVNPSGQLNGPLMHSGSINSLGALIEHYNLISPNPNLDQRLRGPGGTGQNLNLNQSQKNALAAFLRTLSGSSIYTAEKWSDPFDASGNLSLNGLGIKNPAAFDLMIYPNPASEFIHLSLANGEYSFSIISANGSVLRTRHIGSWHEEDISGLPPAIYYVSVENCMNGSRLVKKFVKY